MTIQQRYKKSTWTKMEVRLRAAAAPRTRPARDARATSRSRARARGTRSRTHHRPPIAHRTAQHTAPCIQHLAQQHTFCTLQHPLPAFGWRHPASAGEIQNDTKGCARAHRITGQQRPQFEHEAQHESTCARSGPSCAPKARRAPRAGASAPTRRRLGQPRPRLRPQHALRAADGPRKRATARHAMTLHPRGTLQISRLKPLIKLDSLCVNFLWIIYIYERNE